MNNLTLLVGILFLFSGKPATNAKVILEDGSGRKVIGFQKIGEKGKVTFDGLDESDYQISVVFPEQTGKWNRRNSKYSSLTKANFNPKTNAYYYQGDEGYFEVKFGGKKKINTEEFKPVFREKRSDNERQITVCQFQTRRDGGQISVSVKAITPKKFMQSVNKIGNDISLFSIPRVN